MLNILSAITGIWLTVLITTAIIFALFAILFVIILLVRKKAREEAKPKKEVNLEELQKILDTIKAKQQTEEIEKKDNGE